MPSNKFTPTQLKSREAIIAKLFDLRGDFKSNTKDLEMFLRNEIADNGLPCLLGHIRLCGVIPEKIKHDSSEEKLYAKYTDIVVSLAYEYIGFNSEVLAGRGNTADVVCTTTDYSFVVDAKAHRQSRTAKNQKDYKISSLNDWKHGNDYAILVGPYNQYPSKESQIYQSAGQYDVCIFSYTHLAMMVQYAAIISQDSAKELLRGILESVSDIEISQSAPRYWGAISTAMLNFDDTMQNIWDEEKAFLSESVELAAEELAHHDVFEYNRIWSCSGDDAKAELCRLKNLQRVDRQATNCQQLPAAVKYVNNNMFFEMD